LLVVAKRWVLYFLVITLDTPHAEFDELHEDGNFTCNITLPSIVPQECRLINGPSCLSADIAKTHAAFELMILLNKYGELDTLGSPQNMTHDGSKFYIDSVSRKDIDASHRRVLDCIMKTPIPFQGSFTEKQHYFAHYFSICPIQTDKIVEECLSPNFSTVGFLSINQLEDCEREFDTIIAGKKSQVKIYSFKQLLFVDGERLLRLRKFHCTLLTVVLRTEFDNDTPFSPLSIPFLFNSELTIDLPVPSDPNELVNWPMIEVCFLDNGTPFPLDLTAEDDLSQTVMVDPFRYKHVYFPREIQFDKTPNSAPENIRELSFETIQKLYEVRYLCTEEIKMDQPIIAASSIGFMFSCLSFPKSFSEVSLIPQVCTLFPIKRQYLLDLQSVPLVISEMSHNILMWELKKTLSLNSPIDILKTACTSPSAQMGSDYERLETYGDRFFIRNLILVS
jgi:hypothetical protein